MVWNKCTNSGCSRAGWCKRISYTTGDDKYNDFECGDYNGWPYYVRNKAREIYERDYNATEEFNQTEYTNNNRESGVREDNNPDIGTRTSSEERYTIESDRLLQLLRGCIGRGSDPRFVSIGEDGEVSIHQGSDVFQNPARDGLSPTWAFDAESNIRQQLTGLFEAVGHTNDDPQNAEVEDN